jgi:hypothetical protein
VLINGVFREYLNKFVIVFLDDILLYSKSEEEHEQHLIMVLQVLREHRLYAKLSKCISYQKKIQYLGHIISTIAIEFDPEKIEAIGGWPTPKNVTYVRSFMGLVGYYRRFIKGFSKIVIPITSLQKKGVKFEWTYKCEDIFQRLKGIFTSTPILKIAYPNEDFVVCIDACKEGLGGVLSQKDYVLCYKSRLLKEHERNYVIHDLELAVIVHALKMWRHYLMDKKFELRKDHYDLKHLFGQPTLNARQTRWLEFLSEYDFKINHIKGKENQVVDALSRIAHEVHIASISMYKTDLKHKIVAATNSDRNYLKIKETLQQGNFQ